MASTTAISSGLSGMNANARSIDVIGNNVANVNTTAFKSSRMMFSTATSHTTSEGTAPSDTSGGSNPFQVGQGVTIAGTQRNMSEGVPISTGDGRDLAIEGAGFFVLRKGEDSLYARAGAFRPDADNQLAAVSGERLQGYGVDSNYNIVPGSLTDIAVPVGKLKVAAATTIARFSGNLNSNGSLPTQGSLVTLGSTAALGLRTVSAAAPALSTRLIDIEDPSLPASGTPLFASGQSLQMRNAEKGGKALPTAAMTINATTTVQDLNTFLTQSLGIDSSVGANPDGRTPGAMLDPQTGLLSIVGNTGGVSDLDIDSNDLRLLTSTGDMVRAPFVATKLADADGESVRTTFAAFDSLGAEVAIDVSMVMDGKDSTGTRWRYYAESADDSDITTQLATGTIRFDTDGRPTTTALAPITIDRGGTGAASPLGIDLDFAQAVSGLTSLASEKSELSATFRDGAPLGTLGGFTVGTDGIITGSFSNGLTRTLGQVALATFTNPEGLAEAGGSMFNITPASGIAVTTAPGSFGSGELLSGALEGSNVDLGEEFTKMILASTGYSASSRVIRTADELLQQLLVLGR